MPEARGHAAILGWAGSTERHLRWVAAWYEARGFKPVVVVPRVLRAMGLPWGWRQEGDALADLLHERCANGPIVVHAFSNAGFWTYAAALEALERRRARAILERIALTVIDSAPGFPARLDPDFTAEHSAMAMMPMLLTALGKRPALTDPQLDRPMRAFMRFWYYVSPVQIRTARRSLNVVARTGSWPLLVVASDADRLIPLEHVESFVSSAARMRPVHELRLVGSDHVQHMIRHRHAYFDAVASLLPA
jgi:hypothetical protein